MLILAAPVFIQSGIIIVANESTFQLAQSNTPRPFFSPFFPPLRVQCGAQSLQLPSSVAFMVSLMDLYAALKDCGLMIRDHSTCL